MPSITGHAVEKNGAHPTLQHAKTTTTSKNNRNMNSKVIHPLSLYRKINSIAVEKHDTISSRLMLCNTVILTEVYRAVCRQHIHYNTHINYQFANIVAQFCLAH